MTEQKIIAQKRAEYIYFYTLIIIFAASTVFMTVMYFTDGDSDAYVYLIIAAVFAVLALASVFVLIHEKRLPEVLIYLENGMLHFYNGYECRPEDIRDIKTTYNTNDGVAAKNGSITIYTDGGKIVCRRIKDLAYTTTAIMTLKYGKVYTTAELKAAMKRRADTRRFSA